MLTKSFIHIPGIGETMERSLWKQGIDSWQIAIENYRDLSFGTVEPEVARDFLLRSQDALEQREFQFFRQALGLKEAWRAYPHFKDKCAFLDIETDGGKAGNAVTTIGVHDVQGFRCYVRNQNLESFRDAISHYEMIVTFFGASFDLPMLQKRFRGIQFDQIHLDLCPTLRRVGLTGGLKKIEKQVGIARGEDTDGLTGYEAVLLWRRYERNRDERALQTLIAYNREDVVNLETLADLAYEKLTAMVYTSVFEEDSQESSAETAENASMADAN